MPSMELAHRGMLGQWEMPDMEAAVGALTGETQGNLWMCWVSARWPSRREPGLWPQAGQVCLGFLVIPVTGTTAPIPWLLITSTISAKRHKRQPTYVLLLFRFIDKETEV